MNSNELQERTKQFSLRVIKLVDALPHRTAGWVLGKQLLRSASSVSANYRAARRARSKSEFIAKISIVAEEADESVHWLELVRDAELLPVSRIEPLRREAEKLMRLFAKTRRTAQANRTSQPRCSSPATSNHKDCDTLADIRKQLHAQPFEPMRITLDNGQWYLINHPNLALLTKDTIVLAKPSHNDDSVPGDYEATLSIRNIAKIEPAQLQSDQPTM